MIFTRSTFRQLTAPGYFDFSAQQTEKTANMVSWFDALTLIWQNQVNLFDATFRLWATRDYSSVTVTVPTFLLYLLQQNGIGWFRGTIAQMVAILNYVSKSYPIRIATCFQELFSFLTDSPIEWITSGQIFFGSNVPARFAETLIMYSTSVGLPATPSSQTYTALLWDAPSGWSKTAASATYITRGYLSGSDIIWMTPRSTASVAIMQDAANLAGLPGSPSTGDLCGVLDDGTGDVGAVYYYDGAVWRKTTTPNANQGIVSGSTPPNPGSSVFAPNDGSYISSAIQPPVDGASEGFGYYGIYGNFQLFAKRVDVLVDLTNDGVSNLGMIVFLLRKIKPIFNSIYLNYTTPDNSSYTVIQIYDSGEP